MEPKDQKADALLIVTPEYLHSIPGTLKNALDSVFVSWALRNRPLAVVGYSNGIAAGVRAVEHPMAVAIESEMVPLRDTVLIPKVETAFDNQGAPVDPMTDIAMTVMLDDLEWWGSLLAKGRAEGELAPGGMRATGCKCGTPRSLLQPFESAAPESGRRTRLVARPKRTVFRTTAPAWDPGSLRDT